MELLVLRALCCFLLLLSTFNEFPYIHSTHCFRSSEDDDNEFYAEDVFALDQDDDDTEEADFLSGNWYILISSEECPNGAIRGQLTNVIEKFLISTITALTRAYYRA